MNRECYRGFWVSISLRRKGIRMNVGGLHHVTAVTAKASENVAFYTDVLGLRLVKKTVNQDDVSAYHLFYADAAGSPGTDMTFFDWAGIGSHVEGWGMVSRTAFRVPDRDSLQWWQERLDEHGIDHASIEERGGPATLRFADPEGQKLELVYDEADGVAPGTPWKASPVPQERGIRGLDSVEMSLQGISPTDAVLTEVMGFHRTEEYEEGGRKVTVFEVGMGGPGGRVRLVERPDLPPPVVIGAGGVHHVAFRISDEEEQAEWLERLTRVGLRNSGIVDRYYFKSLYFREPGGVLFELATEGPGFAVDEDPEHLGEKLSLPPFLEGQRAAIEKGLKPIQPVKGVSR
jgi:glyoxalase family protein